MSLLWNKTEILEDRRYNIALEDSHYFDKEGNRYPPFITELPDFVSGENIPKLADFMNNCAKLYRKFQDKDLMELKYKCGHCGAICKKKDICYINNKDADTIRCSSCKGYDNFILVADPRERDSGKKGFEEALRAFRQGVLNEGYIDDEWNILIKMYEQASEPLIRRIAIRIREEGAKAFHKKEEREWDQAYTKGIEQGLSKAFSMLKSIIEFEHPQFNKLITEIEKKTDY